MFNQTTLSGEFNSSAVVEFNLHGAKNRALARAERVASLPQVGRFAAGKRDALAAELK